MVFTKLIVINSMPYEHLLLQDTDVLMTKPYKYFKEGRPQVWTKGFDNNNLVGKILGFTDSLDTSSEIFPLLKSEWNLLRDHIETLHDKSYIDAILDICKTMNAPPDLNEYPIFGAWYKKRNVADFIDFKRYNINRYKDVQFSNYDMISTKFMGCRNNTAEVDELLKYFVE